jgi:hypothetical protein
MAYVEQITFLLFLKMADEQTRPPYNRKPIVPEGYDWPSLLSKEGDVLEVHYRHVLEHLGARIPRNGDTPGTGTFFNHPDGWAIRGILPRAGSVDR